MSDKYLFPLFIFAILVFFVFLTVVLSSAAERKEKLVREMVMVGIEPIKARCAVYGWDTDKDFNACFK